VVRAALRRFAVIFAFAIVGAALLGLLIVALTGDGVERGLAIGFYAFGAGLCGLAFLVGSRPPVRGKTDEGGFVGLGRWMGGGVRWSTRKEQVEALNIPALLAVLGFFLILIGVAVDNRH
jgi:peptidoglycan/LPS O-acetylase OafA/YrhL